MRRIHFAWDLMEQSDVVLAGLRLYAERGHVSKTQRMVYVLVNYSTTMDEDLYRIYKLREMGYLPYTMVYNKEHAPRSARRLARWTNNILIWRSCDRFEDYKG